MSPLCSRRVSFRTFTNVRKYYALPVKKQDLFYSEEDLKVFRMDFKRELHICKLRKLQLAKQRYAQTGARKKSFITAKRSYVGHINEIVATPSGKRMKAV
mmetsp:Transcript_5925/g.8629  ORF Transcript_5925/g.8629 Transcript_5925/m.8629 type:complete len:100 (+) Transcript_5925:116-415(+)|eukprot:CAMPEP_0194216474 /NCGR_PEP_ID=MMETSP0156-20130528/19061_1 /TAXON_ID=33649 /ORGANISM="Thalassionema nitzschioides, Strain L26-B" /LENGTH=99 /DNA_ID=CAMNT_0038945257 /DNA_START=111 /DNA_END=410 /DNA_ORIENTATION=+